MMKLNKAQKKKIHRYHNDVYPLNLYVASGEDLDIINGFFDFYWTVESMREGVPNTNSLTDDGSALGLTCLVVEKKTGSKGVLVVLEDLTEQTYQEQINTIAHESGHVTTAICQYLGIPTPTYDGGDEHFAYLLGWVAGCIANTFIEIKRQKDETN